MRGSGFSRSANRAIRDFQLTGPEHIIEDSANRFGNALHRTIVTVQPHNESHQVGLRGAAAGLDEAKPNGRGYFLRADFV